MIDDISRLWDDARKMRDAQESIFAAVYGD